MDLFKELKATKPKSKAEAYQAGYDCGLHGSNTINCHFSFFATPELRDAHSEGVRDAKGNLKKIKKPSQERQILVWLQAGNSITAMQALSIFGCWNLKGRMYDLRKKGYNIETKMIKTKSGKWIAKYKLIQNGQI